MPPTELQVATPDAGIVAGKVPAGRPAGRRPDAKAHFPQADKRTTRLDGRRASFRC